MRSVSGTAVVLDPRTGAILTDFGLARMVADNSLSMSLCLRIAPGPVGGHGGDLVDQLLDQVQRREAEDDLGDHRDHAEDGPAAGTDPEQGQDAPRCHQGGEGLCRADHGWPWVDAGVACE